VDDAFVVDRLAEHQHRQLDRRPDERLVGGHARGHHDVDGRFHLEVDLALLGVPEEEDVVLERG
jgi:hypothetical protein